MNANRNRALVVSLGAAVALGIGIAGPAHADDGWEHHQWGGYPGWGYAYAAPPPVVYAPPPVVYAPPPPVMVVPQPFFALPSINVIIPFRFR